MQKQITLPIVVSTIVLKYFYLEKSTISNQICIFEYYNL